VVVANVSAVLPVSGGSPGPADSFLKWNTAHIRILFSPITGWWGIPTGWWMFAHQPYVTLHNWYDYIDEIEITDARRITHTYRLPPETKRSFWRGFLDFRQVYFKDSFSGFPQSNPQLLRNVVLWHVRRDMSLNPDDIPPFTVRCYDTYQIINPPGSIPALSPVQKVLLDQSKVTVRDLACVAPWPPHAQY
jgi:hypothetical protein